MAACAIVGRLDSRLCDLNVMRCFGNEYETLVFSRGSRSPRWKQQHDLETLHMVSSNECIYT
jgi:hypothetical protein